MTVTVAIWVVYAVRSCSAARRASGRRLAWSLVAGAALVAVVLPLTHFAA